jgi:transforming growth factor-beta-induced protein
LKPENKAMLTKILTAHVVAGDLDAKTIKANVGRDGFYHMETLSGDALSAKVTNSGKVFVFDESGNATAITISDVNQSNGVIHVVEDVLLPK